MDKQTFKVYVFENKQTIQKSFLFVKFHHLLTVSVARVEMRRNIIFVSPIMGDEWRNLHAVSQLSDDI